MKRRKKSAGLSKPYLPLWCTANCNLQMQRRYHTLLDAVWALVEPIGWSLHLVWTRHGTSIYSPSLVAYLNNVVRTPPELRSKKLPNFGHVSYGIPNCIRRACLLFAYYFVPIKCDILIWLQHNTGVVVFSTRAVLRSIADTGAYKRHESEHDSNTELNWLHYRYRPTVKPAIIDFLC